MRTAAALALAAMLTAPTARADAVDDAAKARYAEGIKLYNKHDYERARVAFLQAAALKKKAAITFMLAECELRLGHWREAADGFDRYAGETSELSPKLRTRLEADRREAHAHLAKLHFDIPEGAEVTVDDKSVGAGELLEVAAGFHAVVVTYENEKKALNVDAEPGKTTEIRPSFTPKPLVPQAEPRTQPTPPPPSKPEEAPSLLAPPATKWPVYLGGAIGVGGLMTAAIFGGIASNARHGIDVSNATIARNAKPGANCGDASSFDDPTTGQSFDTFANACHTIARARNIVGADQGIFQASLAVGVVGMVGAVGWFFFSAKEGEKVETTTELVPWLGPTGAGTSLSGRF